MRLRDRQRNLRGKTMCQVANRQDKRCLKIVAVIGLPSKERFPRSGGALYSRQFRFTTRAPCRSVIFAFGQRWHAAK